MEHMIEFDFSTIKNSRKRKSVKPRRLIKQKKQPIGKPGARISDKKMKLNEPSESKKRKKEKLLPKLLRSIERYGYINANQVKQYRFRNNVRPNVYWLNNRRQCLHFMLIWKKTMNPFVRICS